MAFDTIEKLLTSLAVRLHAFAVCEIKAGWRLAFDPMEAITIHYVLAGTGTVRVPGAADLAYAPCTLIVVPAGVSQSLGEPTTVLGEASAADHCGLTGDGLVRFTAGDGSRDTLIACGTITASYGGALGVFDQIRAPVAADLSHDATFRSLFASLLSEVAAPGIGTQAMTEALMKQCVILLLRRQILLPDADAPLFPILEDHRLRRAVAVVLERPTAPYTVDALAALAGMSRSAFADRFSRVLGQTPMEFVQRVRLRLGAELLRATDLPIKVIAASVGYSSGSYFSRAFRQAHGIDPRSFRERAARNDEATQLAAAPSVMDRIVSTLNSVLEDEA